jgi:hypothetical protein
MKVTIIEADDWKALWINGRFVSQHHEINLKPLILGEVQSIERFSCEDPLIEEVGQLPEDLDVVKATFKLVLQDPEYAFSFLY